MVERVTRIALALSAWEAIGGSLASVQIPDETDTQDQDRGTDGQDQVDGLDQDETDDRDENKQGNRDADAAA
jgi:hypothetical protein